MKKPKLHYYFSRLNVWVWFPKIYYQKHLLWKDKHNTPRVEYLPHLLIIWLKWQLNIVRGTDDDWEWYLWVTKYNEGLIHKAKGTWPWYSIKKGIKVQSQPWLKYNK